MRAALPRVWQGRLHVSRQGPSEGVVRLGSAGAGGDAREVLVSGRAALNRAMHGDTVARAPCICSREERAAAVSGSSKLRLAWWVGDQGCASAREDQMCPALSTPHGICS